ncbi:MAG: SPOR domain-containing protein [Clostridia bacterium]|nr:SPOR domain-containing protein [Clostridia bacterium]
MRSGRLKTRRYKVRRGISASVLLVLLLTAMGGAAGGYWLQNRGLSLPVPLSLSPSPTLTPDESAAESRQVTLPGRAWYALQLGAFERENAAREGAASFRSRGAAGYLYRQDTVRILGAAYETRSDAQAVQTQLRTQHGIEAWVTEIARPEISLRLTGQKAQLTALSDAYDLIDQAAEQFSALSQSLDQQKATRQEVLTALQSQRDTVDALYTRLETLFGSSPHAAVGSMKTLLNDLSQEISAAFSTQGATSLGAQVKYCQLLCVCRMAEYAAGLAQ